MPKMSADELAAKRAAKTEGLSEFDPETTSNPSPEAEPAEEPEPEAPAAEVTPIKTASRTRKAPAKPPTTSSLFAKFEDVAEFYNGLWWGREGSGKTSDVLSAANHGRVLVINAEGGLKRRALENRGINTDNIMLYPLPGEALTFEGTLDAVLQVKSDLEDDPNSWFAVIMDSATEVVAAWVEAVGDDRIAKARARGASIDTIDSMFTDRSDYGTMGKMLRRILRPLRDMPVHFLVTALERRDVDEDTSKVAYGPAVNPGIQSDLLGYVDFVLYCREPDDERPFFRAATKQAGKFRSKDRLDALPKVLVEPTFSRVLGYINEDISEKDDPQQAELAKEPVKPPQGRAARAAAKKAGEEPAAE